MYRRAILATLGAISLGGCTARIDGLLDSFDAIEESLMFEDATEGSGFTYQYAETGRDLEKISNAGVYVSDVNNDGWADILALGGTEPILFKNEVGEFRKSDAVPDLDVNPYAALFVDVNNNGWEDLLLMPMAGTAVFLENREGTFEVRDVGLEVTLDAPISAAAADATGNGYPDIFIIENGDWDRSLPSGYREFIGENRDNGGANRLFENTGDEFVEITDEAGIEGERWSLATSFLDVTGNGHPDIHVANDFSRDVLYINEGDRTFRREELGEATDRNGMSSEVADFTGDGRPDIFVTNIYYPESIGTKLSGTLEARTEGNNLLINDGEGEFQDAAEEYGIRAGGWGWAAVAADFDNDGLIDLIHGTSWDDLIGYGLSADEREEIVSTYPFYRYPAVWRGTDTGFERIEPADIGIPELDSRGIACLDRENNGQLDLVIADASGQYRLFENIGATGKAIQLVLRSDGDGTALGATVEVTGGETRGWQVADSKTDYVSQRSRMLHFGVGENETVDIDITWPDGSEDRYENVETAQRFVVTRDTIIESIPLD